ncbi:hypothetical protein FOVG_16430 [Fusarium oxysporum f. sp. pisi HDV247]|uniref:Uncharacterized protein n=1 Tax=Fusarium oxysporum f. sp. pisi HDV247 TaxID=1080344 RepID=W9NI72_FUSOX|nr:hypothetical protein FOVG_16430 [Fusarium oxysporum f. sp. pisi HDV247]
MPSNEFSYNSYFVHEKDLKYVPPYIKDVPETPNEVECRTSGPWPTWLEGTLLRIGGGRFTIPLSEDGSKPNAVLQHFFDGLAMLHKFRVSNGHVYYTSRHTADGVARNALKNGYVSSTVAGLNPNTPLLEAQDPYSTLLGGQQTMFMMPQGHLMPDEVNVNVVPRRGMHIPDHQNPHDRGSPAKNPETEEIIVQTDFNVLQVCDAKTLEPKRMLTYAEISPDLAGFGICAHPPKDRKRGLTFNYIINPETGVLSVFALNIRSNPASVLWQTPIPCAPCYVHSLAMTENFVVFIRNPVHVDVSDLTKPFTEALEYEPDTPTQFFVLDKVDGKHIATYDCPRNFIFFHAVNAYDYKDAATGEQVIHVDLCSYSGDYVVYREYSLSNFVDPAAPFQQGALVRYELAGIDTADVNKPGRVTIAGGFPGSSSELPRVSKRASMRPGYRYVYSTSGNGGPAPGTSVPIGRLGNGLKAVQAAFLSSLTKFDWKTGTYKSWQPADGESCPSEPIFVERPGATKEDDGVVLSIIINKEGTHSILVLLDAESFTEIARADMPQVYGMGPHGSFIEGSFGL